MPLAVRIPQRADVRFSFLLPEEYRLSHPLVSFNTLEDTRTYQIFAGFVIQLLDELEDADMLCYRVDLASGGAQLQVPLDFSSRNALFVDPEVKLKLCDQLLTRPTCTSVRKSERFVRTCCKRRALPPLRGACMQTPCPFRGTGGDFVQYCALVRFPGVSA